ncbi:MAG: DUF4439 domain-containing protein [Nakamurella sp.]
MTSPSTTPDPTPAADPSAGASIEPSAGVSDSPTAQSVAAAPTTAPPGPLGPDAVTALQAALAAEQAAVWAYGLVAAYARDQVDMIAQVRSGHLLRRDATTARLVQGGAAAPEPAAAYQVSVPVTDAASALTLAQDIETDAAAAWRVVIGSTDDAELRGFALTGLSEAAVRLAMWKQTIGAAPTTVAFPGQAG